MIIIPLYRFALRLYPHRFTDHYLALKSTQDLSYFVTFCTFDIGKFLAGIGIGIGIIQYFAKNK